MITPSKEGSEEECGTRVEVGMNSDISERFLNTDTSGSDHSVVYPRTPTSHVYLQPRLQSRLQAAEHGSVLYMHQTKSSSVLSFLGPILCHMQSMYRA